jgi:tight adherence protein B
MIVLLNQVIANGGPAALLLLGGAVFLVLVLLLAAFGLFENRNADLQRRVARIGGHNRASVEAPAIPVESLRRNTADSRFAGIDRLTKRVLPNVEMMRQRLTRSGWRLKIGDYLLICIGLWIAVTGLVSVIVELPLLADLLIGFMAGFGLPYIVLNMRIAKRTKKFTTLLPEALDLIVRGIRSGLPVTEAMNTIADEIEDPVGTEFRRICDQMKIGVQMDDALWAAARPLAIAEFNFLVISMTIQRETGGNLAEILENLSDMVRRREQMRLKVKAMSSEARASAMIIGSLPFIMCAVISTINPGYMSTLFEDPRGWVMIGIGLSSMLIGLVVMAKMIRFEI